MAIVKRKIVGQNQLNFWKVYVTVQILARSNGEKEGKGRQNQKPFSFYLRLLDYQVFIFQSNY